MRRRAALHIIDGMAVTLLATQTWPSSSTSSPTCSSSTRAAVPGARVPPGGRPDPFLRSPIAQLALDGRAKDLRDRQDDREQDRPDRQRGGDRGLTKRKAQIPAGVASSSGFPHSAQDRPPDLAGARDHDGRGAAESGGGGAPPDAAGAGCEDRGTHPQGARREAAGEAGRCSPSRCGGTSRRRSPPRPSGERRGLRSSSVRRRTETVKDIDIIATASDPAALTEYFTRN